MPKTKSKRLFKVAKEFNVSTGTIIDILSSEGYEIKNKPTAKLNKEMSSLIEDYFSNGTHANVIPLFKSSESDSKDKATSNTNEKHITINEGDSGIDFEKLFDGYINKDTQSVVIVDPYVRMPYQIENLMHCIDFFLKTKRNNGNLSITLITNNVDKYKKFAIENFEEIAENLSKYGVNFSYQFDESIHDRHIKVDDEWKILMGRGLDIYKESKLTEMASYDLKKRSCKKFNITYLPKGSF